MADQISTKYNVGKSTKVNYLAAHDENGRPINTQSTQTTDYGLKLFTEEPGEPEKESALYDSFVQAGRSKIIYFGAFDVQRAYERLRELNMVPSLEPHTDAATQIAMIVQCLNKHTLDAQERNRLKTRNNKDNMLDAQQDRNRFKTRNNMKDMLDAWPKRNRLIRENKDWSTHENGINDDIQPSIKTDMDLSAPLISFFKSDWSNPCQFLRYGDEYTYQNLQKLGFRCSRTGGSLLNQTYHNINLFNKYKNEWNFNDDTKRKKKLVQIRKQVLEHYAHSNGKTDNLSAEEYIGMFNKPPQPKQSTPSSCGASFEESVPEVCNHAKTSTNRQNDCHIIGAGPAGLFTALFLSMIDPQLTIKIYEARICNKSFDRKSLLLIDANTGISKFLKDTLNIDSKCRNCVRAGRLQEQLSALCFKRRNITVEYGARVSANEVDAHRGSLCTVDASGARIHPHTITANFGIPTSIILAYVRTTNQNVQRVSMQAPKDYEKTVLDLAQNLRTQNKITMELRTGIGIYKYGTTAPETYYYVLLSIVRPLDETAQVDARGKRKRLTSTRTLSGCVEASYLKNDLVTLLDAWFGEGVCVLNLDSKESTDLRAPRIIPYFNTLPGTLWSDDMNLYNVGDSYKAPKWIYGEGVIQSILTSYAVALMITKQKEQRGTRPDGPFPPFVTQSVVNGNLLIEQDYSVSSNSSNINTTMALISRKIAEIQRVVFQKQ